MNGRKSCAYAEMVARRFCPNILPYEVGTAAVFGFAGWNGRSLTGNAADVMFSIAANAPVSLGIGKESVTSKPSKTFPVRSRRYWRVCAALNTN
jgi:hypothetical protein